jgi:hypothetical protein
MNAGFGIDRRGFLFGAAGAGAAAALDGERYPYATAQLITALDAPTLPRIQARTAIIHNPEPGAYRYSHHPHIIHCFGTFFIMWSSGVEREDRPGQRILWSRSTDGKTWSKPEILLECPEPPWRLTAAGWAAHGDRLYAFINRNRHPADESLKAGVIWYPPLYVDVMEAGRDLRWSAPRAIDSDLVANESPRMTSAGTWLLAGYSARIESGVLRSCDGPAIEYVFHPVPRVLIPLDELKRVRRTPPQRPLGEPTWYQRRDKTLVSTFRDDHAGLKLFASVSADDGITWSRPRQTNIPDAKSKTAARVLTSGATVLVSNPCVQRKRNVLAVLSSRDGTKFDRGAVLRDEGSGRYAYPSVIEREGRLWVAYSINKNQISVSDFPISELG